MLHDFLTEGHSSNEYTISLNLHAQTKIIIPPYSFPVNKKMVKRGVEVDCGMGNADCGIGQSIGAQSAPYTDLG